MTNIDPKPALSSFADVYVNYNKLSVRLGMQRTLMDDNTYDYGIVNFTINNNNATQPLDVFTEAEWEQIENEAIIVAQVLSEGDWS